MRSICAKHGGGFYNLGYGGGMAIACIADHLGNIQQDGRSMMSERSYVRFRWLVCVAEAIHGS